MHPMQGGKVVRKPGGGTLACPPGEKGAAGPAGIRSLVRSPGLPVMSLAEYVKHCHTKGGPPPDIAALAAQSDWHRAVLEILSTLHLLEPASAWRPGACDIVNVFDKVVSVPPATVTPQAGEGLPPLVKPGEAKLIRFCAPMGQAQVIEILRALPLNRTAYESGSLIFKRLSVTGFSEGFCNAGEPGDGGDEGTFQNVEHVILCPGAGFDLYARNFARCSTALFKIEARVWSTC